MAKPSAPANTDERKGADPSARALRLHAFYKGKVQVMPKCPVRDPGDFAIWYTPGVAAPCRAIAADPASVYDHTNKGNAVAVVSDGSRVLGLGDIGPEAGLPVMEGKALLFKYLGGVDAVPLCIEAHETDDIVRVATALAPSFGGINLEDIAQPKCFRVLEALQRTSAIPVWHDDQQGSATAALAGLLNALKIVGKELRTARIALIGIGAANVATYRLLRSFGADPAGGAAAGHNGTLHRERAGLAGRRPWLRSGHGVPGLAGWPRLVGEPRRQMAVELEGAAHAAHPVGDLGQSETRVRRAQPNVGEREQIAERPPEAPAAHRTDERGRATVRHHGVGPVVARRGAVSVAGRPAAHRVEQVGGG